MSMLKKIGGKFFGRLRKIDSIKMRKVKTKYVLKNSDGKSYREEMTDMFPHLRR